MHHDRAAKVLSGTPAEQAAEAVALLAQRGALTADPIRSRHSEPRSTCVRVAGRTGRRDRRPDRAGPPPGRCGAARRSGAPEPGHRRAGPRTGFRGCGRRRAGCRRSGCGHHIHRRPRRRGRGGRRGGSGRPSTPSGPCSVRARHSGGKYSAAWRRHSEPGLVGDAVGIDIVDDELVAAKPAFSGALLADIVCTSDVRLVSVRPGVLPLPSPRQCTPDVSSWPMAPRSRVRRLAQRVTTTSRCWPAPTW